VDIFVFFFNFFPNFWPLLYILKKSYVKDVWISASGESSGRMDNIVHSLFSIKYYFQLAKVYSLPGFEASGNLREMDNIVHFVQNYPYIDNAKKGTGYFFATRGVSNVQLTILKLIIR